MTETAIPASGETTSANVTTTNADYAGFVNQVVSFLPLQVTATFTVVPTDDNTVEGVETFTFVQSTTNCLKSLASFTKATVMIALK